MLFVMIKTHGVQRTKICLKGSPFSRRKKKQKDNRPEPAVFIFSLGIGNRVAGRIYLG
jgi:hypothetical protein